MHTNTRYPQAESIIDHHHLRLAEVLFIYQDGSAFSGHFVQFNHRTFRQIQQLLHSYLGGAQLSADGQRYPAEKTYLRPLRLTLLPYGKLGKLNFFLLRAHYP